MMRYTGCNSAVACSPCTAEAKSAASVATTGVALDARGYLFGNRPPTWLKPGLNERLAALHAEDLSYHAIAVTLSEEFNVKLSRNACIGRAKRMHLPKRSAQVGLPVERPVKKPSGKIRFTKEPKFPVEPLPVSRKISAPKSRDLTITQLRNGVCRWPYGDNPPFRYCGHPAQGSWCPAHRRLVYIPSREARS